MWSWNGEIEFNMSRDRIQYVKKDLSVFKKLKISQYKF